VQRWLRQPERFSGEQLTPARSRLALEEVLEQITRPEFLMIHDTHWGIESFHRAIKQVGGIGRFQVIPLLSLSDFCDDENQVE
jgi:hypothetical protein